MSEYITRAAAIDAVMEVYYNTPDINLSAERLAAAINSVPAADVAQVIHARWITRSDKGVISMTHPYMCSRCWRVEMNKEPYCNCGAKMDGDDNDADD